MLLKFSIFQRSQTYIAMLPKDKQLFAAQLRRRQLQRQLPLHDLHSKFCDSVTEKELQKFLKFAEKRKNKAAGIGNVGSIPDQGIRVCTYWSLTMWKQYLSHMRFVFIIFSICQLINLKKNITQRLFLTYNSSLRVTFSFSLSYR